jgi:hypothetical protein
MNRAKRIADFAAWDSNQAPQTEEHLVSLLPLRVMFLHDEATGSTKHNGCWRSQCQGKINHDPRLNVHIWHMHIYSYITYWYSHERMGSVTNNSTWIPIGNSDLFATGKIKRTQQISITKNAITLVLASSSVCVCVCCLTAGSSNSNRSESSLFFERGRPGLTWSVEA